MYPPTHFLFPFFLAELLVKINILTHEHAIIAGLIGMFIDIDHLIAFILHHKDWNLKHVWNAAVVKHEKGLRTFIHHELGFILVTLFVVYLFVTNSIWFWIVSLGYYSHILLDQIPLHHKKKIKIKGFTFEPSRTELKFDLLLMFLLTVLFLI